MGIKQTIRNLAAQRKAVILAHNYQPPEIQELADLCGDSLELSIKASQTDAEVIVFCGVHFMAETASIISPDKTVLLPRHDAGCPMADMVDPESLEAKMSKLAADAGCDLCEFNRCGQGPFDHLLHFGQRGESRQQPG